VTDESTLHHAEEHDIESGVGSGKLALWLFLASEVMFFSGLICSYIVLRWGAPSWPDPAQLLNIPLTGLNTFILICSSVTMVKALSAAHRDDQAGITKFLGATIALGATFLAIQAYEYYHLSHGNPHHTPPLEPLLPWKSLFGATFYSMTGFHGFHVTIGVIWLICVFLGHIMKREYGPKNFLTIELAGLYWHFVDLVWILLFTIVYLI
jgi:cytochrome c oxidase subunit 3